MSRTARSRAITMLHAGGLAGSQTWCVLIYHLFNDVTLLGMRVIYQLNNQYNHSINVGPAWPRSVDDLI